jgi:hypothetical protein
MLPDDTPADGLLTTALLPKEALLRELRSRFKSIKGG